MNEDQLIAENIRFAARLSLHEYLLEQLLANAFLTNPQGWDEFSKDIVKAIATKAYTAPDSSNQPDIQRVAIQLAENFGAKVREQLKA